MPVGLAAAAGAIVSEGAQYRERPRFTTPPLRPGTELGSLLALTHFSATTIPKGRSDYDLFHG